MAHPIKRGNRYRACEYLGNGKHMRRPFGSDQAAAQAHIDAINV